MRAAAGRRVWLESATLDVRTQSIRLLRKVIDVLHIWASFPWSQVGIRYGLSLLRVSGDTLTSLMISTSTCFLLGATGRQKGEPMRDVYACKEAAHVHLYTMSDTRNVDCSQR